MSLNEIVMIKNNSVVFPVIIKIIKTTIVLGVFLFLFFIAYLFGVFSPGIIPEDVAVSPVVVSPDGNYHAQVFRREFEITKIQEDPRGYRWILVICLTNGAKCAEGCIAVDSSNHSITRIKKLRNITYDLSWDTSQKTITCKSNALSKNAYYLGHSVFSFENECEIHNDISPMSEDIKNLLMQYGIEDNKITSMSYFNLSGENVGASSNGYIYNKENVLLVIGPDYKSQGKIISYGPILLLGSVKAYAIATSKWMVIDGLPDCMGGLYADKIFISDSVDLEFINRRSGFNTPPIVVNTSKD